MKKIISILSGLSRRSWQILLLAAIFIIFYNVAEDVQDKEILSVIDPVVGQWVVSNVSVLDRTLAQSITRLGSWNVLKIGIAFFAAFALFKRRFLSAGILVGSVLSGLFLNAILKQFFMRARPDFLGITASPSGYSFPSNHSMISVIFYGMIAYLLTSMITNRNMRVWVWALTSGVFVAVGLSRIILGVHYLTDVLGGWLAGGSWLLVCILVSEAIQEVLEKLIPKFSQSLRPGARNLQ